MDKMKRTMQLVLLGLLLLAGCSRSEPGKEPAAGAANDPSATGKPVAVTLALNWFPEVEHGGFYAALVHGYYAEAGLDVKILPGGPEAPVVPQVATGAVTFGVANADDVLFGRAQQAPIVAVLAPLQTSPRCLIVHEKLGIKGFADLKNMTIAMSSARAFAQYLRKKLPLEGVQIVPYSGSVAQFLLHEDYAQQGYVFSEPFVIRRQGGDPKELMLRDIGFNPYTSVLVANEKTLSKDPAVVRKMADAVRRGWEKYLADPLPTNERIHALNPEMGMDILAFGSETIRPLVVDEATQKDGLGHMSPERWQTLLEQLVETNQIDAGKVDSKAAFVNLP